MKYDAQETKFEPRTYLVWRTEIEIRNITDQEMWQTAFGKVHEYVQKNNVQVTGPGTALYFRWDEAAGKTELGIGNPVEGVSEVHEPDLSLVSVAESKAVHTTVQGGYEQLHDVHGQIAAYLKEHHLTPTLTIEEYTVMGMDKPDPQDWKTNVYYLHE